MPRFLSRPLERKRHEHVFAESDNFLLQCGTVAGVNLITIVVCVHRHLLALNQSGICEDDLFNHPASPAFVRNHNSLYRMSFDREVAALETVDQIAMSELWEFKVIPL